MTAEFDSPQEPAAPRPSLLRRLPWPPRLAVPRPRLGPWSLIPAYLTLVNLHNICEFFLGQDIPVWIAVQPEYLAILLTLLATLSFGRGAIAPVLCLMSLHVVGLSFSFVTVSRSAPWMIPILLAALSFGLDPYAWWQSWAQRRRSRADVLAVIAVLGLSVSMGMPQLSFSPDVSWALAFALLVFVGPRPLWPVLLGTVVLFALTHGLTSAIELQEDAYFLNVSMRPFPHRSILGPVLVLGLINWLWTARYSGVGQTLCFAICSALTLVYVSTPQVPSLVNNTTSFSGPILTSWQFYAVVLAGIIIRALPSQAPDAAHKGIWRESIAISAAIIVSVAVFYGIYTALFGSNLGDPATALGVFEGIGVSDWFRENQASRTALMASFALGGVHLLAFVLLSRKLATQLTEVLKNHPIPVVPQVQPGRLSLLFGKGGVALLLGLAGSVPAVQLALGVPIAIQHIAENGLTPYIEPESGFSGGRF